MPSKLDQLQQQFRQRLDQQKEEKLTSIRIYNENQQKVLDRVSLNNRNGNNLNENATLGPNSSATISEMRQTPKSFSHTRKHGSGVDRSRPLKPMAMVPSVKNEVAGRADRSTSHLNVLKRSTVGDEASNMVLGNARIRPPVSTSLPSSATNARNAKANPPLPASTKVEVKKTGAGNKMIQTTTKPNEITKVTVETIKKKNPGQTITTVKTTVHKRTIVPAKSAPARSPAAATSSTVTPATRKPLSANASTPVRTPARAPPADPNMAQCSICNRNFNKDRIDKHAAICQKTSVKKRKAFDATKMRVKGTEAEEFVKRGVHKKEDPKPKKNNWRTQHENFIESIRQAKIVQKHLEAGGKLSDLPPPKPSENPDYVPCPHCGRKFNAAVAERHIPKCKNILSNKKPVKKK